MCGQETQRGAVQKTAAALGAFDPKPVHRGHQPQHARNPTKGHLRNGLVIDAHLTCAARLGEGRDFVGFGVGLQNRGDFPSQSLGAADQVVHICTA